MRVTSGDHIELQGDSGAPYRHGNAVTTVPTHSLGPSPPLYYTPVTYQQEWMWNTLRNGNTLDFIRRTYAWRVAGPLDLDILGESVATLVTRHTILRTRVDEINGEPVQGIHEARHCRLMHVSPLTNISDIAARKLIEQRIKDTRASLFAGTSFTIGIVSLSQSVSILTISMHHMCTDLTSLQLLFHQLWQTYGEIKLKISAATEESLQYSDYAIWQRGSQRDWTNLHSEYWKQKLSGGTCVRLPPSELAADSIPHNLGEVSTSFCSQMATDINQFARRQRTMPAFVALTSYLIALSCWTNTTDLLVPFNVSGRHVGAHQRMIGPMGHMLFVRVQLARYQSFSDCLDAVFREFTTAQEHLDSARLSCVQPELLQGGFFQWLSWDPAELTISTVPSANLVGDLSTEPFPINAIPPTANMTYDMAFQCMNARTGIVCRLWYRTDLFAFSAAQGFLLDFRRSVELIVADSTKSIASFQMACHQRRLRGD